MSMDLDLATVVCIGRGDVADRQGDVPGRQGRPVVHWQAEKRGGGGESVAEDVRADAMVNDLTETDIIGGLKQIRG